MTTETDEICKVESENEFELEILKVFASTCYKHIEESFERKRALPCSTEAYTEYENEELKSVSNLISSLLYDFSRSLQNQTCLFNTFELIEKSCDSIKKKLKVINYSKWNRIQNKNYKNVYNKILKRSLDPTYRRSTEQINDDFKVIFRRIDRTVNIWAHQVLYDDLNIEKSYNEPPQVQVIRFDMSGEVIITGGSEGMIKLWDVYSCKSIMSMKRHSGAITNIDVHPTNAFIVSSCEGGEIWLWEVSYNFYRPHRMLKSTYKFLWVRFLVNDCRLDLRLKKEQGIGRMDDHERRVWEKSLDETLIVSLDASSTLRVYKMRELLSSSAGDNVYTEVTPLYYLDLFNHNITAYDLSKLSFNGSYLTAIGIEPLDNQDFESGDLDCINTSMNYIKNDTFHKSNLNIKGRYRDLIGKSGFALLMIPLNDPSELGEMSSLGRGEDCRSIKRGNDEEWLCCCDAKLESSVTCINTCVFCGKSKFRENKRLNLSVSHYDGKEPVEQASVPKSMFLWTSQNASELEKFCNEVIPDFTFFNTASAESSTPNIPTMHYGKMSSSLILPSCLSSGLGSEMESEHFDKLFLNFVNDAHVLSPDVCFANTSTNHISASDDAKIFLWSYQEEVFKSIQLTTKTIERWKSAMSGKGDSNKSESKSGSTLNASYGIQERSHKSNQKQKPHHYSDQYKSNHSSASRTGVSGERESQSSMSNNTLYVVVSLCWSSHDKYVCVADSMVSRYNYRKSIAQARTNLSGLSFFTTDGRRISDFLHDTLSYHVSCVSFNPVCEEVCVATSYEGLIAILDVKEGVLLKKMSFGSSATWLDVQWHPMGHKFVASQKYGSFSLFSSDQDTLYERTPTFQSTYLDFYCNSISYSNSAYTGPESNSVKLRKYYSNFSNVPITLNGDATYEKITKSLEGGPVVFLDERKNNVIMHTMGGFRRWPPVHHYTATELVTHGCSFDGSENDPDTSNADLDQSTDVNKHTVSKSTTNIGSLEVAAGCNSHYISDIVGRKATNNAEESVDLNIIYSTMSRLEGFQDYFEAHYQVDESGDVKKIVNQYLELMKIIGRFDSEKSAEDKGAGNMSTRNLTKDYNGNMSATETEIYDSGLQNDKSDYQCYLGDCPVCENYLTLNERAQKYASVKDSFVQLKCLTDKNGNIVRAMPPSARPQDLAESLTPEAVMTPPGRADVESLVDTTMRTRYIVQSSPLSDEQIVSNPMLGSSMAPENNLFWGSSTDSMTNIQGDQLMMSSLSEPPLEEGSLDEDEEEDDAEFELDQDEEEDEDEEEEEDEYDYDEDIYSEDDFMPEGRITRSMRPERSRLRGLRRGTRTSSRLVKSESEEGNDDEDYDNDEDQGDGERSKDGYSFRRKRGRPDSTEQRQVKWARNLSMTIGPVPVKYLREWREDHAGKICVFCGIGERGDYSRLTRTQSHKLSSTILSIGSEFRPACRLFKNTIVGPMGIPRRFHSDLDDYFSLFKRVESSTSIFAHVSCLLTSKVKLDAANRLLNLPEVLVRCSFDECSFCGSKFATVPCEKCEGLFHYPCAIAQYQEFKRKSRAIKIINHYDPLVCKEYTCVECAMKGEKEYLSSDCFISKEPREWLMRDEDIFENEFNLQKGDTVVLTNVVFEDKYNAHISWLTQKNFPILAKVVDIAYVFKEKSIVLPCVLIGSYSEEFEDFCIFVTRKTRLILLRDYLMSIYNLTKIEVGSKVKCRIQEEVKEVQVMSVKPIETVDKPTNTGSQKDLNTLKKIVKSSYSIGHNSVSVQDGDKSKWVDSWNISIDDLKDGVNIAIGDSTINDANFTPRISDSGSVSSRSLSIKDLEDDIGTLNGYPDDEIEFSGDSTSFSKGNCKNKHPGKIKSSGFMSSSSSSSLSRRASSASSENSISNSLYDCNSSESISGGRKSSRISKRSKSSRVSYGNSRTGSNTPTNNSVDNTPTSNVTPNGISANNEDSGSVLINEIKLNTFLEVDKQAVMELLGETKYATFYNLEEATGDEGWLTDYWKNITLPICIRQIVERLFNQYYRTPEGICGDISLMISNCMDFNEPSTKYCKLASELKGKLEKIREIFESPEEWKVILSYLWPKIRNVVELPDSPRKSKAHTREEVVKQEPAKASLKRKDIMAELPIRRSSRLQKNAEKEKKEEVKKKKTRYNLR
ncbi:hypothetical protein MACJ_000819 [Theileria orientalis]|uniref:Bromo domain-containing protein n=1 Tax=Theileria orientalis TaxID=68886 RepID=A0A976QQQ4_THEOR|nr:hypothetical protein MACJ_000819 [Theileria orientalis]